MTNKTIIALAFVAAAILTTSTVYATSDWRTTCGINNPIDNLECAVDTVETELNSAFGLIADHETRINTLESATGGFVPSVYMVPWGSETINPASAKYLSSTTEENSCNPGDLLIDVVGYKNESIDDGFGNIIDTELLYQPTFLVKTVNVNGQLNQQFLLADKWTGILSSESGSIQIRCLDLTP